MKPLAPAFLVTVLLVGGCTGTTPPSGSASSAATASAAATSITIQTDQAKQSKTETLVDAPGAIVHENSGDYGPPSFAVAGDRVWLIDPNPQGWGTDHVFSYLDSYVGGVRKSRTKLPDHYCADVLARQGMIYTLQTAAQGTKYSQIVSYQIDGASLASPKTLKADFMAGDALKLRFDGESLVTVGGDGTVTLVDGPGPVKATPRFEQGEHSVTIPAEGSVPQITVQAAGEVTVEWLGTDERFVYYLIWDVVTKGGADVTSGWVYRFNSDGSGTPQAYRLQSPKNGIPDRPAVIANGNVYQLTTTSKTARVLLVNPVS